MEYFINVEKIIVQVMVIYVVEIRKQVGLIAVIKNG